MKTFMDWIWGNKNTNENRKILSSDNGREMNDVMRRVDKQIGRAVTRLSDR